MLSLNCHLLQPKHEINEYNSLRGIHQKPSHLALTLTVNDEIGHANHEVIVDHNLDGLNLFNFLHISATTPFTPAIRLVHPNKDSFKLEQENEKYQLSPRLPHSRQRVAHQISS